MSKTKWIKRDEAMALIHCVNRKTLLNYRKQFWTEGVHFQVINRNKILYNEEMILHWLDTRHDPASHLKAVTRKLKNV